MKVKLGVADRIQLSSVLPGKDNYLNLMLRDSILSAVKFSEEEIEGWDIKTAQGGVTWDGGKEKEIEAKFSDVEVEYLRAALEKLNSEKSLTPENFNLYKIFVVNKEGTEKKK
jgi:hypothetical protein